MSDIQLYQQYECCTEAPQLRIWSIRNYCSWGDSEIRFDLPYIHCNVAKAVVLFLTKWYVLWHLCIGFKIWQMSNCVFLSTEIEVVQIGVFMASSRVAFLFPSMKSDSSLAKAWLVVWNMFYSIFQKIWDVILPIDELIFFQDGQNHQPVCIYIYA